MAIANIAGPNQIGALLLFFAVASIAYLLYAKLRDKSISTKAKKITAIGVVAGFVVAAGLAVPGLQGLFWKKAPAKKAAKAGPKKKVTVPYEGYVYGIAEDAYSSPAVGMDNATVKLYRQEPTRQESPPVFAEGNTKSDGSFLLSQDKLVEGSVWVSVNDNGFYPAKGKTELPGPGVFPPERLYVKNADPVDIGSLDISLYDSSTNVRLSGSTIYENVTTSKTAWFELKLANTESESALRDLQTLMIRGADWDTLGASVNAYFKKSPDDISVSSSGDKTLVDTYTCELNTNGEEEWGDEIIIHFELSVDSATSGLTHLKLNFDDLLSGEDFEGGTGISETTYTVQTET